jgi:hypothetical protein
MKRILPILLLPGCATLGIPAPWHSTEEVTEIADGVAADRVAGLATAIEADIAPLPSLVIPDPYKAPEPVSGDSGPGWAEVIGIAALAFFGRGIPSKGPIKAGGRMLANGLRALFSRPKESERAPPA